VRATVNDPTEMQKAPRERLPECLFFLGGADGDRTHDLMNAIQFFICVNLTITY